jgi:hypothetical protein
LGDDCRSSKSHERKTREMTELSDNSRRYLIRKVVECDDFDIEMEEKWGKLRGFEGVLEGFAKKKKKNCRKMRDFVGF